MVFFTNSGTEANELAMLIARLYTGSHDIISLRNAYHGNAAGTMGATAQGNWKFNVIQVIFFYIKWYKNVVYKCDKSSIILSYFLLLHSQYFSFSKERNFIYL